MKVDEQGAAEGAEAGRPMDRHAMQLPQQDAETFAKYLPSPSQVESRSRVQVWWLTRMRGYRVALVLHRPVRRAFGGIRYASIWLLESR